MRRKLAFLVLGPEASGTRMMTELFIKAGCHGDTGHEQRFDNGDISGSPIVIRRSYPHRQSWPRLYLLHSRLVGYDVKAVIMIRSFQFTAQAALNHSGENLKLATEKTMMALPIICRQLNSLKIPFRWMTYEALVQRPQAEIEWLMEWAGLQTPDDIYVYDANEKYCEAMT